MRRTTSLLERGLRSSTAGWQLFWRGRGACALAAVVLAACGGCQALVPNALPGGFALSEDARIEKQAKADSFPSPADVGLEPVGAKP
jgi:hypothetical protein